MTSYSLNTTIQKRIKTAPLLTLEEEHALVRAAKDGDLRARNALVEAHLKMAVRMIGKIKVEDINDLIQEATLALIRATETFDLERGVRFSTYARAWIQEYQWSFARKMMSMVNSGNTTEWRRAEYHLIRKTAEIKLAAQNANVHMGDREAMVKAAEELQIPTHLIDSVLARMSGDYSLSTLTSSEDSTTTFQDLLVDEAASPEASIMAKRADTSRKDLVADLLSGLSARHRIIIMERFLAENKSTLETLGQRFKVSKERVRQEEASALTKLRAVMEARNISFDDLMDA